MKEKVLLAHSKYNNTFFYFSLNGHLKWTSVDKIPACRSSSTFVSLQILNKKWKFCMLYINTLFWIICREDFSSAFDYSLCYGTTMKTRCNWRRRWKQADRWTCEDDRLTVYFKEMVDAEIKQKLDITEVFSTNMFLKPFILN